MREVGVIGVGAMGLPMALRLKDRGHVVAVTDIDPARRALAASAGLACCRNAAELARRAEVLIVAVVDATQAASALFDSEGAFAPSPHAAPPARATGVVLCPTIGPQDVVALADRMASLGIQTVEAPMSGGPVRARDGTMSLMVAASPEAWAAHDALLRDLSDRIIALGPRLGDGARVKLVNNLLAASHLAAAAEAMVLAQRVGLAPSTVLDVFERSSAQSWIASDRMRRWLAGAAADGSPAAGGALPVQAALALLAKDTRLAGEMARDGGLTLPIMGPAMQAFWAAAADGREGWDDAHLVDWIAERQRV